MHGHQAKCSLESLKGGRAAVGHPGRAALGAPAVAFEAVQQPLGIRYDAAALIALANEKNRVHS